MAYRTDDPVADFERRDAEQEAWLATLPVCFECDHPIQSEECYEINGELICPECLNKNHLKHTDDYAD